MKKRTQSSNYSNDSDSLENYNYDDKYSITGESSFSRDLTVPFDSNDVLSERNYGYRGNLYGKDIQENDLAQRDTRSPTRNNFIGRGPKGYTRSDNAIYEDACEALYHSPDIDASSIEVRVDKGIITLTGHIEERGLKKLAEHLVENVSGAIDVHNEIKVRKNPHGLIDNITGMN